MPPCHIRNVKLVAEADLPILPFLAPRVFQPWPNFRQPSRSYSSAVRSQSRPRGPRTDGNGQGESTLKGGPEGSTSLPWTLQNRCYSTKYESGRPSTRKSPSRRNSQSERPQKSRGHIAQDWYENALAGLDAQLVEGHDQNYKKSVDRNRTSLSFAESAASRPLTRQRNALRSTSQTPSPHSEELHKIRQRNNARRRQNFSWSLVKSRFTAQRMSARLPQRTKWAQVGYPVRLTKSTENPDKANAPGDEHQAHVSDAESAEQPRHELGYTIPETTYRWSRCFARLEAKADAKHPHDTKLALDPRAVHFARTILDQEEASLNVAQLEERFTLGWHQIWLHAMISLLETSPGEAPRFLALTCVEPYPPPAWINDCLQFLASHFAKSTTPVPANTIDEFVDVLCSVMDRPGPVPMLLKGSVIRLLLPRCTKDQVLRIFDGIARYRVQVHWNTLLHLSTSLTHHNCFDQALDALLHSVSSNADPRSSQFESTCATILRKASSQPDGLRVSLRIIQNLAEVGVKLNIQHCNIVMLNAVESGDLKSAFDVYHSLVDHGLVADKYTHAILLKGCKSAIEDSETLNATIRQAIRDTEVLKSPIVATEILHCLYMHHFRRNPESAFSTVAEAYSQLFDATSLIRIHILPADCQDPTEAHRPRPTLAALGIMVSAYLRDHTNSRNTHSARQQYDFYKRMRTLVQRNVQPWAELAQTDHVANAFLMAFTSHPSTLAHAAEVIRDMQAPLPATTQPTPQVERHICKPTVQSWSIFLNGFTKHQKMDLAEQVMNYMRGKGMQPNQVTWNSLISGYARVRNHDAAVEAFRQMQDEGFRGNEVTFKSLRNVSVDVGMLNQGEEVREALRARIQKEEALRGEEDGGIVVVDQASDAVDGQGDAEAGFWDSAVEDDGDEAQERVPTAVVS